MREKMTIARLIEEAGGNAAFSRELGIPLKTVEGWKAGKHCADYNVAAYKKTLLYNQLIGSVKKEQLMNCFRTFIKNYE